MVKVRVRVWKTKEESEEREMEVNSLSLVPQVALLGFQFRNGGAQPVGIEMVCVLT